MRATILEADERQSRWEVGGLRADAIVELLVTSLPSRLAHVVGGVEVSFKVRPTLIFVQVAAPPPPPSMPRSPPLATLPAEERLDNSTVASLTTNGAAMHASWSADRIAAVAGGGAAAVLLVVATTTLAAVRRRRQRFKRQRGESPDPFPSCSLTSIHVHSTYHADETSAEEAAEALSVKEELDTLRALRSKAFEARTRGEQARALAAASSPSDEGAHGTSTLTNTQTAPKADARCVASPPRQVAMNWLASMMMPITGGAALQQSRLPQPRSMATPSGMRKTHVGLQRQGLESPDPFPPCSLSSPDPFPSCSLTSLHVHSTHHADETRAEEAAEALSVKEELATKPAASSPSDEGAVGTSTLTNTQTAPKADARCVASPPRQVAMNWLASMMMPITGGAALRQSRLPQPAPVSQSSGVGKARVVDQLKMAGVTTLAEQAAMRECCVCMDEDVEAFAVFVNCGHAQVCVPCAERLAACPVCATSGRSIRLFM